MSDDNGHSTLPAPHPATPEWAVDLYNILSRTYHELVQARRREETRLVELRADVVDHERRISRLEGVYIHDDTPTSPGSA